MAIRIECDLKGYEDVWVDFRERPWLFGDRRKLAEALRDSEAYRVLFGYVEDWTLRGAAGEIIPAPAGRDDHDTILDPTEERLALWLVKAWYIARAKALALPKAE